jgi:hypothetical protein
VLQFLAAQVYQNPHRFVSFRQCADAQRYRRWMCCATQVSRSSSSTKIWFLLVCALLPERECDNERAADAKLTFDPYLAAVGADNQLATVEAQPGAFD